MEGLEDRKILKNIAMLLSRALLTLNDELKIRVKRNLDECLWCIKNVVVERVRINNY